MRLSFNPALAACLLGAAAPAAAVQANRASEAQLHGYVEAVAVSASDGRIVRFESPVCPRAYGLPEALNSQITERMRTVAAAVGAVVTQAGCTANLLLFVPKDRKHLFAEFRQSRPEIFGRMTDFEISALANSADSSVAWQILKQRGADGRELSGAWREGQPLVQESVTNSRQDKQRGAPAPLSLTAMDLAYLKSLYRNASTFENPRRVDLESEMKRSLPNP